MSTGVIEITLSALKRVLNLPTDTNLVEVIQDPWNREKNIFGIIVQAPNIPEVKEGEMLPRVKVVVHESEDGTRSSEIVP